MLDGKVVFIMKNGMSIEFDEGSQVHVNDKPINNHMKLANLGTSLEHDDVLHIAYVHKGLTFVYNFKGEHFGWAYGYRGEVDAD